MLWPALFVEDLWRAITVPFKVGPSFLPYYEASNEMIEYVSTLPELVCPRDLFCGPDVDRIADLEEAGKSPI
jgi:hypothetical protein